MPARTIGILFAATLIAALAGCQRDAAPTGVSGIDEGTVSLATGAGVPECGFENGDACPILSLLPRCDRGLRLTLLAFTCVNDTRHLVGSSFRGSWTDWALANQRTLAVDEPLNWVMHLTTHNGYNNIADGETRDPNQIYSLSDQLDLGSRFLSLDLHWVFGEVRLCHAIVVAEQGPELHIGCTAGDRALGYAVKEIADWLAANPNEIVTIDLEAYPEGMIDHVVQPLNAFLGSKIYRVADRPDTLHWPSRREMRALGKQVIIGAIGVNFQGVTHPRNYLQSDLQLRYIKHFEVTRTSGIVTGCFGGNPRETLLRTDQWFRVVGEDRTTLSLSLPQSSIFHVGVVRPPDVADLAACGIRLISLDMLESPTPTLHPAIVSKLSQLFLIPNRVPTFGVSRQDFAVWSWSEGDRGGSGDAAVLRGGTGRWNSAPANQIHPYACARPRSETTVPGDPVDSWTDSLGVQWRVTARAGPWREGGRACLEEYGADGFVYSVPVHGFMNGRLRLANASGADVWMNYNDIEREGAWVINRRPLANAGADQTVECTGHHLTQVQLNGTGSTDPDGHAISYDWRGPFGVVTGAQPTVMLPIGRHEITMIAEDAFGGVSTDIVVIDVVDTTPPEIHSVMATPSTLWSPNHKMEPVTVAVDVTDICDPSPTCRIVGVASNEPVNGKGDGNTEPDWRITGALTLELRAERAGPGAGRVYTITVECTDASGNLARRDVTVTVSHDQRKGG